MLEKVFNMENEILKTINDSEHEAKKTKYDDDHINYNHNHITNNAILKELDVLSPSPNEVDDKIINIARNGDCGHDWESVRKIIEIKISKVNAFKLLNYTQKKL